VFADSVLGKYVLKGLTIGTGNGAYGMKISNSSLDISTCDFNGNFNNYGHVWCESNSNIYFKDSWSVSVGTNNDNMFLASDSGYISMRLSTCTITASITVGTGNFLWAYRSGVLLADACTWVNASNLTGKRGLASVNGILRTSSTLTPGNAAPTTATGGQYEDSGSI
jgi:hypothetical protein